MSNWNELLNEISRDGSTFDIVRRKYLKNLSRLTGRNTIVYYSGWLQKPNSPNISIDDNDKNGFMNSIHGMDSSKGLDLILHTPGGETAATETIVDYLRSIFGIDIRVIVPQLAMSGGTMIACAAKEIIMGKQSSLGPIDPQLMGMAAHGVIEEFDQAYKEISADKTKIPLWQVILSKYPPTLIGECQKSIKWAETMVRNWLSTGMFKSMRSVTAKTTRIDAIVKELGDHSVTLSHARHLSAAKAKTIGLKIAFMESDQKLQDAVMSVHHSLMLTFNGTPAIKIIESDNKKSYIQTLQTLLVNK